MQRPRITVITPCRNQVDYIERTICSVLDQGYEDLEYIVVDGGSDDGTEKLISLYEDRITKVIREEDHGPAEALNRALMQASGDVVGILYADDLYLPGALEAVGSYFALHGEVGWATGRCLRMDGDDQMLGRIEVSAPPGLAAFLMHDCGPIPTVGSFFRRTLLEHVGKFDTSLGYAFDYELMCRLLAGGHVPGVLPQVLSAQREHGESRSAMNPLEMGREFVTAARRYGEKLSLAQRVAFWRNCDQRERIFALARAEMQGDAGQRFLWQQVLRHPWWFANPSLRHALLTGSRRLAMEVASSSTTAGKANRGTSRRAA